MDLQFFDQEVRIFDNGGKTLDRYAVFIKYPTIEEDENEPDRQLLINLSPTPYSPNQGVCLLETVLWTLPDDGLLHNPYFGNEIEFAALPQACQNIVMEEYAEIYGG